MTSSNVFFLGALGAEPAAVARTTSAAAALLARQLGGRLAARPTAPKRSDEVGSVVMEFIVRTDLASACRRRRQRTKYNVALREWVSKHSRARARKDTSILGAPRVQFRANTSGVNASVVRPRMDGYLRSNQHSSITTQPAARALHPRRYGGGKTSAQTRSRPWVTLANSSDTSSNHYPACLLFDAPRRRAAFCQARAEEACKRSGRRPCARVSLLPLGRCPGGQRRGVQWRGTHFRFQMIIRFYQ